MSERESDRTDDRERADDHDGETSMTETTATTTTDSETDETAPSTADRVRRGVDYLLLAGLAVFALVAAVGVYTSVQGVIQTWVQPDYQPIVNAAFNLVVLLVVGAGLVRQVRRLS
ncbi:MAG: hypothetical protein ABEJ43_11505 [Haloferacaceae archaeon]